MNARRWSKAAALALGLVMALSMAAAATRAQAAETPVTVRTQSGQLPGGSAVLRDGTTYVSLRTLCEAMGANSVVWKNGRAEVKANGWTMTVQPGNTYLTANGRYFYAPNGVTLTGGTLMVPLRAAASAFGAETSWTPGVATVSAGSGSAVSGETYYDADVLYWLSRIISAESRGEPLEGQIAVGNVVLNRVASTEFPNTVYDVVFDRRYGVQFEPVSNGTVYDAPTEQSVVAAKLVLEGANTAGKSLYFFAPALSEGKWIAANRPYSHTIGCHRFYL